MLVLGCVTSNNGTKDGDHKAADVVALQHSSPGRGNLAIRRLVWSRFEIPDPAVTPTVPEALGRVVGHLDAALQDGRGEVQAGVACQPQPKPGMRVGGREPLHDPFQRRHPGDRQVAVLQHHPAALVLCGLDEPRGLGALALSQGDAVDLHTRQRASRWTPGNVSTA